MKSFGDRLKKKDQITTVEFSVSKSACQCQLWPAGLDFLQPSFVQRGLEDGSVCSFQQR